MSSKKRKKTPSSSASAAADPDPATAAALPSRAAPATAAAPRAKKWRCDICLFALFDTYDEALAHERTCCPPTAGKEKKKKSKKEVEGGEEKAGDDRRKNASSSERATTPVAGDAAEASTPEALLRLSTSGSGSGGRTKEATTTSARAATSDEKSPSSDARTADATTNEERTEMQDDDDDDAVALTQAEGQHEQQELEQSQAESILLDRVSVILDVNFGGRSDLSSVLSTLHADNNDPLVAAALPTVGALRALVVRHMQRTCLELELMRLGLDPATGEETLISRFPYAHWCERRSRLAEEKARAEAAQDRKLPRRGDVPQEERARHALATLGVEPAQLDAVARAREVQGSKKSSSYDSNGGCDYGNRKNDNGNGRKRKKNWRCDVCLIAVFEEYDDALEHEKICTGVGEKLKKKKVEAKKKRDEEEGTKLGCEGEAEGTISSVRSGADGAADPARQKDEHPLTMQLEENSPEGSWRQSLATEAAPRQPQSPQLTTNTDNININHERLDALATAASKVMDAAAISASTLLALEEAGSPAPLLKQGPSKRQRTHAPDKISAQKRDVAAADTNLDGAGLTENTFDGEDSASSSKHLALTNGVLGKTLNHGVKTSSLKSSSFSATADTVGGADGGHVAGDNSNYAKKTMDSAADGNNGDLTTHPLSLPTLAQSQKDGLDDSLIAPRLPQAMLPPLVNLASSVALSNNVESQLDKRIVDANREATEITDGRATREQMTMVMEAAREWRHNSEMSHQCNHAGPAGDYVKSGGEKPLSTGIKGAGDSRERVLSTRRLAILLPAFTVALLLVFAPEPLDNVFYEKLDLLRQWAPSTLLLPTTTSVTLAIIVVVALVVAVSLVPSARDALFCPSFATASKKEEEKEETVIITASVSSTPTLREYLSHPDGFHMAFAPAFFGFFAYFGALAALEEETGLIVPKRPLTSLCSNLTDDGDNDVEGSRGEEGTAAITCNLNSTSGASAGAMAAVMLAAGIEPRAAADFASTFTWGQISDPPGLGGYAKGHNFESCMRAFILEHAAAATIRRRQVCVAALTTGKSPDGGEDKRAGSSSTLRLEEALVPVAVSGFDILRMKEKIMCRGCMAKAARASAGFPGLFQPVPWREEEEDIREDANFCSRGEERDKSEKWWQRWLKLSLLVDGGITDGLGLNGLPEGSGGASNDGVSKASFASSASSSSSSSSCTTNTTTTAKLKKEERPRVINMIVGEPFGSIYSNPLPKGVSARSLVSIALVGAPTCGPWAMKNGPRAVESTRRAVVAMLDSPMERVLADRRGGKTATTTISVHDTADDGDNKCQHYVLRVDASKWLE